MRQGSRASPWRTLRSSFSRFRSQLGIDFPFAARRQIDATPAHPGSMFTCEGSEGFREVSACPLSFLHHRVPNVSCGLSPRRNPRLSNTTSLQLTKSAFPRFESAPATFSELEDPPGVQSVRREARSANPRRGPPIASRARLLRHHLSGLLTDPSTRKGPTLNVPTAEVKRRKVPKSLTRSSRLVRPAVPTQMDTDMAAERTSPDDFARDSFRRFPIQRSLGPARTAIDGSREGSADRA